MRRFAASPDVTQQCKLSTEVGLHAMLYPRMQLLPTMVMEIVLVIFHLVPRLLKKVHGLHGFLHEHRRAVLLIGRPALASCNTLLYTSVPSDITAA